MSRGSDCCGTAPTRVRRNAPGLTALSARIGTWSSFRAAMVGRLASRLPALTTRASKDDSIALIDAAACVGDVLTFYQERILNEGYLPTCTEERSAMEIARSIGFEPGPGVAATVALAFTIDPSSPVPVTVPKGHPVMSVPGQDELPQTFETSDAVEARAGWNSLRPRRTRVHPIAAGTTQLYLHGTPRLDVGAAIVVLGQERAGHQGSGNVTERWDLRFVTAVGPVADAGYTLVTLDRGLGDESTPPASLDIRVFTFRGRAGLFGWNAPDARMMSEDVRTNADLMVGGQWRGFSLANDRTRREVNAAAVDLDQEYPAIVVGSWVCLQGSTDVELFEVVRVNPAARTDFSLTARVTRVFLDATEHLEQFSRRGTTVLHDSEELELAERPDDSTVSGHTVELDGLVEPIPQGRTILVKGTDPGGVRQTVLATVAGWVETGGRSSVTFLAALPALRRDTVEILGNAALGTHGATVVDEALGNGDASAAHQTFTLRKAPLTWVPAVRAGAEPAIELRVDGLLWSHVDALYGAGSRDRVYTLNRDSEGKTVVSFGNGHRGARLPSGTENVRATYRAGIGLAGEVAADRLTLLQQRPPGLRGVTNPAPAAGAADPDRFDELRTLAPLQVLTLGRLVSLQDYEDFAAAYPGIGKAKAVKLWDGRRGLVHLTVASRSGAVLASTDPTAVALVGSITELKDPAHHTVVSGHVQAMFGVGLRVVVRTNHVASEVTAGVVEALKAAFSFAARQFVQPVFAAEVIRVVHSVPGVVAVDLDHLYRAGQPHQYNDALPAAAASWDGANLTASELLLIDPAAIDVGLLEDT